MYGGAEQVPITTVPSSVPGKLFARSDVLRARTVAVPLMAGDVSPVSLSTVT